MDRVRDLTKMVGLQVDVAGRGFEVFVTQEELDGNEIGAVFEQVGGKGMPEKVRVDAGIDALAPRPVVHAGLDAAAAQA